MSESMTALGAAIKRLIDGAIRDNLSVDAYMDKLLNTAEEYSAAQEARNRDIGRMVDALKIANAEVGRVTTMYNNLVQKGEPCEAVKGCQLPQGN